VALALAWLAVAALAWVARIGPLRPTRAAVVALPFMLVALPLVFTRPGDPIATIDLGPLTLTISAQGLREFATIALKSWVSVQVALLLAFTTPFHDLVDALRELRLPRVMVGIIAFMYRYLAVLGDESSRMIRARAARSAVATGRRGGGGLRWRGTVTGRMVGSLFLRSYERSERVYAAMQARGFDGELRYLPGPALRRSEVVVAAALGACLVLYTVAAFLWLPHL